MLGFKLIHMSKRASVDFTQYYLNGIKALPWLNQWGIPEECGLVRWINLWSVRVSFSLNQFYYRETLYQQSTNATFIIIISVAKCITRQGKRDQANLHITRARQMGVILNIVWYLVYILPFCVFHVTHLQFIITQYIPYIEFALDITLFIQVNRTKGNGYHGELMCLQADCQKKETIKFE